MLQYQQKRTVSRKNMTFCKRIVGLGKNNSPQVKDTFLQINIFAISL